MFADQGRAKTLEPNSPRSVSRAKGFQSLHLPRSNMEEQKENIHDQDENKKPAESGIRDNPLVSIYNDSSSRPNANVC